MFLNISGLPEKCSYCSSFPLCSSPVLQATLSYPSLAWLLPLIGICNLQSFVWGGAPVICLILTPKSMGTRRWPILLELDNPYFSLARPLLSTRLVWGGGGEAMLKINSNVRVRCTCMGVKSMGTKEWRNFTSSLLLGVLFIWEINFWIWMNPLKISLKLYKKQIS